MVSKRILKLQLTIVLQSSLSRPKHLSIWPSSQKTKQRVKSEVCDIPEGFGIRSAHIFLSLWRTPWFCGQDAPQWKNTDFGVYWVWIQNQLQPYIYYTGLEVPCENNFPVFSLTYYSIFSKKCVPCLYGKIVTHLGAPISEFSAALRTPYSQECSGLLSGMQWGGRTVVILCAKQGKTISLAESSVSVHPSHTLRLHCYDLHCNLLLRPGVSHSFFWKHNKSVFQL